MNNKLIHFIHVYFRAKRISQFAREQFDNVVHYCCGVSASNNELSYEICRVGAFGGPVIVPIRRPDIVVKSENVDSIIIKDGFAFELNKSHR